jgi:hypothetical protein
MFSGFNLKLNRDYDEFYSIGNQMFEDTKIKVENGLKENITSNNDKIDGSKVQEDWFPTLDNIDVFISHSHSDKELAVGLAGYLKAKYNIVSFVDSSMWGYANNLLKIIDDEYCQYSNSSSYDYDKRNYSTSHVHMMLSAAINKMIDKAECIIFLNTQNSNLGVNDSINNQTASPWIYSEIAATRIIRRKKLTNYRPNNMVKKGIYNEANRSDLNIQYDIPLGHLIEINDQTLKKWDKLWKENNNNWEYPLDALYKITINNFSIDLSIY